MCVDFNQESGLGHLTRAQTFYEAALKFSDSIFLSCELNPGHKLLKLDLLQNTKFLNPEEIVNQTFDVLYVDTYSEKKLEQARFIKSTVKVVLLDSNYKKRLPDWPDLVIDVERTISRRSLALKGYIFGVLCVSENLESISKKNREKTRNLNTRKKIVVNFGGSSKADLYLSMLHNTFLVHQEIDFQVYCPTEVILQQERLELSNVCFTEIGSNYIEKLEHCDLLVTSSGTSFLEGLYLNIPIVVFNIFQNAQENFYNFRENKQVLFAGQIRELSSNWLPLAVQRLDKFFTIGNQNTGGRSVQVVRSQDIYNSLSSSL
jgi:spore coat polysaccharide biosynthesis predicted glycosyltransferase SpsG